MLPLVPQLEEPKQVPVFNTKEQEQLEQIGDKQTEKGEWMLPDGRQMLNKQITVCFYWQSYTKEIIGEHKHYVTPFCKNMDVSGSIQ